ncbi:hypothetical protein HMI56_005848, partial [Coelomomyces lativittatus]
MDTTKSIKKKMELELTPRNPIANFHHHLNVTRLNRPNAVASLFPSSVFKGTQTSGNCKYNVIVTFHKVDLTSSLVEGFLRIENLTKDLPEITTYFDGEIIGKKFSFLTEKWNTDKTVDGEHW